MWFLGNLTMMLGLFDGLSTMLPDWSTPFETMLPNSSMHEEVFNVEPFSLEERITMAKNAMFSDNFLLGVATSAYQVEGAWNVSDKGLSIWDKVILENPQLIRDEGIAAVAVDFYHRYKTDIDLAEAIGANSFRISLSWPRILPNGFNDYISQDAIRFYNGVINEMTKKGITPMVTLFHWDLPQNLQELGGWTNPLITEWFLDYARIVFREFGDRVKIWSTLEEPRLFCSRGYGGDYPPMIKQPGLADYLCGHNTLITHAKVYRMYQEEFASTQKGKVGIIMALTWPTPDDPDNPEEHIGAEMLYTFANDWFLHPIFSATGDYPERMKNRVKDRSLAQGFLRSRLPEFTTGEIEMIRSSADFLGVNFYHADVVRRYDNDHVSEISYYGDIGMIFKYTSDYNRTFSEKSTPNCFSQLISRINGDYRIPMIIITGNGYADDGEHLDSDRAKYFYQHLSELLPLIADGINIRGYFVWSLMDNFHWTDGYSVYYGIYSVNFFNRDRPRTPKMSTKIISDVFKTKKIPEFATSVNEIDFVVPLIRERSKSLFDFRSFFEDLL